MTSTDSSRRASDDDDGVAAAALAGNGEAAAGERVVDALGQRALADDGELRGGGQRAADQRAEGEDERRLGRERIGVRAAFVEQQPRAEAAAADELAQHRLGQRHALDAAARHVDAEIAAVIAEGHRGYPPASADRISTQSSSPSGVAGSLTNSSPLRLAASDGCSRSTAISSARRGHPRGQRRQQLAQGVGLDLQFGDAGALAGNAQKLNMHMDADA